MNMPVDLKSLHSSTAIRAPLDGHPDAALLRRYEQFLAAREAMHAAGRLPMNDLAGSTPKERKNHRAWEAAVSKACDDAGSFGGTPANTIDGMLLKLRVYGFYAGNHDHSLEDLDHWTEGTFVDDEEALLLTTLREDLLRLKSSLAPIPKQSDEAADLAKASDPILAAIERHRASYLAWAIAGRVESVMPSFGPDHDPEMEEKAREEGRREYALFREAGLALTTIRPTTTQGIRALLAYIDEFNRGGLSIASLENASEREWSSGPDNWPLVDDERHDENVFWSLLLENIRSAL